MIHPILRLYEKLSKEQNLNIHRLMNIGLNNKMFFYSSEQNIHEDRSIISIRIKDHFQELFTFNLLSNHHLLSQTNSFDNFNKGILINTK